jgi:hypothetical protein
MLIDHSSVPMSVVPVSVGPMGNEPPTPEQVLIAAAAIGFSSRDVVMLEQGVLTNVHQPEACIGSGNCWVHRPSAHHMITWAIRWRQDRRTAERACEHKIGHPDPDGRAFNLRNGGDVSMHGCDGCCGVVPEEG